MGLLARGRGPTGGRCRGGVGSERRRGVRDHCPDARRLRAQHGPGRHGRVWRGLGRLLRPVACRHGSGPRHHGDTDTVRAEGLLAKRGGGPAEARGGAPRDCDWQLRCVRLGELQRRTVIRRVRRSVPAAVGIGLLGASCRRGRLGYGGPRARDAGARRARARGEGARG